MRTRDILCYILFSSSFLLSPLAYLTLSSLQAIDFMSNKKDKLYYIQSLQSNQQLL